MHIQIAGALTGRVTKWIVLLAWLAIAVLASGYAQKLSDVQNNDTSSWLPDTAESTLALERLQGFTDENDFPTLVVYHRDGGLTADDYAAMSEHAAEMAEMDGVVPAAPDLPDAPPVLVPPDEAQGQAFGLVSPDGEVATIAVTFNKGDETWEEMPAIGDDLREIAELDGVETHLAGIGGQTADQAEAFEGIDSTLLFAALGVVVIILLFTYRSPVLWVLPVFTAVVGLFTAQAVIYFLARDAGLTVNGQSQGIMSVLVIGAGTDYALLLVARYREELRRHDDRHEAMAFALHRAAPALIASGSTVAIGMLCLMFADMNSTAGLGPVAAIAVAITLLAMLTLLPALLVIFGRWVFWPKRPLYGSDEPTTHGFWARLGQRISRRPRTVWIGTAVALAVACLGILTLNPGNLSTEDQYTQEFDSITGQKLLTEHELQDSSTPIQVVTDTDHADDVVAAIEAVPDVGEINQDAPPQDGTAYIEVSQGGLDPASDEAADQVIEVREAVDSVEGADVLVGGSAALFEDVNEASSRDNVVIIPIVLLVVMIILMVLLRSLLAPILLIGTVVLSFGAALGISALVFEYIFGFHGVDSSFPLFVFVFLVALGIDYNIFLMSRVREETPAHGTRKASLVALASTGGVITSAGIVLAATFSVLGTIPLVAFATIGTAVAIGVMLDTLIVRAVLVTALNLDLGGAIWWPSRLDRGRAADDSALTDPIS